MITVQGGAELRCKFHDLMTGETEREGEGGLRPPGKGQARRRQAGELSYKTANVGRSGKAVK